MASNVSWKRGLSLENLGDKSEHKFPDFLSKLHPYVQVNALISPQNHLQHNHQPSANKKQDLPLNQPLPNTIAHSI
jgi:hypothetical protein